MAPTSEQSRTVDPSRAPLEFQQAPLHVQVSLAPEGPILDDFYRGYDEAFVLPNEKETLSGFRECLAQNFDEARARLTAQFGEFREAVMVARDRTSGAMIGGANFICFPLRDKHNNMPLISMNLNYIFIAPEQRGKGYLRKMLAAVRHAALLLLPIGATTPPPVLIFLEQNDPARMGADAYARDTTYSGLDQRTRNAIWLRLGARTIGLPYVQPALSPSQAPDRTLLYAVIGAHSPKLSACLLRDHLRCFFGISVLKGRPLDDDPEARAQLAALGQKCADGIPIDLFGSDL